MGWLCLRHRSIGIALFDAHVLGVTRARDAKVPIMANGAISLQGVSQFRHSALGDVNDVAGVEGNLCTARRLQQILKCRNCVAPP